MTTGSAASYRSEQERGRLGRPTAPLWVALGVGGWVGLAWLLRRMLDADAAGAGFDLELILQAGRDLSAGRSPYDPAMLQGIPPAAPTLFFSYPPHVAQLTSLFAGTPMVTALAVLWAAAALGVAVIAASLTSRIAPTTTRTTSVLVALAVAPFCLAFATGLLFGNVNVLFPLAYGLMLLAALGTSRADLVAGGIALALATVTKLHPGSMAVWFLVRGVRERRAGGASGSWLVLAVAIVVVLAVLGASIAAGGLDLWSEYARVVRTGASASIIDPRNAGPAAQIALIFGLGDAAARFIQVPVTLLAVAITVSAAWRLEDPIESVGWAAAASLATLPVTWYHYPAAFIPFAIAAALRARGTDAWSRTVLLITAGLVVAGAAIVWLPLQWVGIGLVLAAVRTSASGSPATPRPATAPA